MINAQNTGKATPSINQATDDPITTGFGTVFDPVQGLQQRLGDFSAEHISEAEKSAQALIIHLTEVERKLSRLVKIQRWMSAAQKYAAGGAELDLSDMKDPDNPPSLPAPEYSGNLIPFPRPHKALKEISKSFLSFPAPTIARTDEAESEAASDKEPMLNAAVPNNPTILREEFPSFAAKGDLAGLEVSHIAAEDFPQPEADEATDSPSTTTAAEFPKNDEPEPATKVEERIAADFDQRLLDDLIKNYGEFSAAAASTPLDPPVAASQPSHDKEGGDFQVPAAFPKQNAPSGKKGGQLLDRELKKIIKDYGQYDLYSRRSPINLKVAVIAALLMLGALFSWIYFSHSSKDTGAMNAPEARSTSAPTPIATESPKEATKNIDTGIADRSSLPGVEQRSSEAGNSQ